MGSSVDVVTFGGVAFRRYPDSSNWAERSYFTPGMADRKRGVGRLHEEVWRSGRGEIRPGHHIHHIDFDPLNNDLANLACLTEAEHSAAHSERTGERFRAAGGPGDAAREAAARWHASDSGRAWHGEHSRQIWRDRVPTRRTCEQCGHDYETRKSDGDGTRFCSGACRAAARRDSGADDVTRACACCGDSFAVNRYSPKRFCDRACANRHRYRSCGCVQPDGGG